MKLSLDDGYVGWSHQFYGKKKINKKIYPYKVIYPYNGNLFRSDYPFGSLIEKKINGAVDINKNLPINDLAKILKNLLQVPYKWGGKSSLGFDCSGLVQSVLNSLGLMIPRDAHDQFKFFDDFKININDAKYGDLHFFGNKRKVNHVAFCSGDMRLIHAQGFVKEETLNASDKNFNEELLDKYLSTHSIRLKFDT